MSTEPQGSPAPETPPTPDAAQPTATSSIINELSSLGRKMGTTVQSALSSPEFKDFEREVRDGFNTAVNEMNDAISKARSTDVAKDVSGQAGKVVDVKRGATTSHVRIEIAGGVVITASITNEAVDDLGLKVGDAASAIIKASEVIVGKH